MMADPDTEAVEPRPETKPPRLIGLDWGTTSLRAYLLAGDGAILETAERDAGILKVAGGDFEGTCAAVVAPLRAAAQNLPIIASGMITSRNGWVETPYLPVPAGPADLAAALVRVDMAAVGPVHFVTGLLSLAGDVPDVMRGEETEIVGQLALGDAPEGTFILPGTHVKWVRVEAGRIAAFSTFMTGEAFAALRDHTILGRLAEPAAQFDEDAFRRGAAHRISAGAEGGALLNALFSARTLPLTERLAPTAVEDYLSGLMIGAEVAEALSSVDRSTGPLTIVGRGELCRRYAIALALAGRSSRIAAPGAAASGQAAIARAAGLIGHHP